MTTMVALILLTLGLLSNPFNHINYLNLVNLGDGLLATTEKLTYIFCVLSGLSIVVYNLIHPRLHKPLLASAAMMGLLGISAYAFSSSQSQQFSTSEAAILVSNGIASALMLGSVLGAMITGHWYLVQNKLSMSPLKNSSIIYILSVLLRIGLVSFSLFYYWNAGLANIDFSFLKSINFHSLIFYGRFAIGLVIPLILGIMVWNTAKIRSTQSATGILYATTILVLIGETFAKFLYFSTGIPF
ncbi:hypothetical protein GWN42_20155 [candidate division KSB1 bacterium]|nr:hypothetical protein [candidate division KSB1 bacterium]NIS26256.1 hypothetical protein [candidate division KSB1 bacterium]NIU26904.1 hypothetical protein [candidate division KSB1 bacterium]NIU92488.1 hypothetical protein [candidate division KSB1 bacterium]NIV95036.1 hypothetical protein [candidate division KSB1 bacterium]